VASYGSEEAVKCVPKQQVNDIFKATESFMLSFISEQISSRYHCQYYDFLYDCDIERLSQTKRYPLPHRRSQFKFKTRYY